MPVIDTVGIISKPGATRAAEIVPTLVEWLHERGIATRCDESSAGYAHSAKVLTREKVPEGCQLMIVLGGDGTLLATARALSGLDIPVLPVNLGGLGFLTAIATDELYPELERALNGEHRTSKRRLLQCDLVRGEQILTRYEAMNDVVATKASIARMIDLDTYIDEHFVCTYKADGIIVSTPTGSTAYSLSAGGPIIFPTVNGLCITPICPHMLTNRPVIVPDTSVIRIACRAEGESAFLTIDGQVGEPMQHDDQLVCRSSPHSLRLIRPPKLRYFDVLRKKLKWGER